MKKNDYDSTPIIEFTKEVLKQIRKDLRKKHVNFKDFAKEIHIHPATFRQALKEGTTNLIHFNLILYGYISVLGLEQCTSFVENLILRKEISLYTFIYILVQMVYMFGAEYLRNKHKLKEDSTI